LRNAIPEAMKNEDRCGPGDEAIEGAVIRRRKGITDVAVVQGDSKQLASNNLIALNATIEDSAGRDDGRCFAVVARGARSEGAFRPGRGNKHCGLA